MGQQDVNKQPKLVVADTLRIAGVEIDGSWCGLTVDWLVRQGQSNLTNDSLRVLDEGADSNPVAAIVHVTSNRESTNTAETGNPQLLFARGCNFDHL